MTQAQKITAIKIGCRAIALALAIMVMGGRLQAQTLAVPGNMPIVYKEIPGYAQAKQRARYKIKLPQCTIEYRGDGYCLTSDDREFVILNQNPACLKRFAGKTVAVHGKTTENVVPWFRVYFIVIDEINGKRYEGKVSPWVMREPTDEEIRSWNLHRQLPSATQKFLTYLALPKTESDLRFAESDGDTLAQGTMPETDINRQLTSIQRQLTAIEQKVDKKPYRGIYSTPTSNWNSTDWSLYMDLQGGG